MYFIGRFCYCYISLWRNQVDLSVWYIEQCINNDRTEMQQNFSIEFATVQLKLSLCASIANRTTLVFVKVKAYATFAFRNDFCNKDFKIWNQFFQYNLSMNIKQIFLSIQCTTTAKLKFEKTNVWITENYLTFYVYNFFEAKTSPNSCKRVTNPELRPLNVQGGKICLLEWSISVTIANKTKAQKI